MNCEAQELYVLIFTSIDGSFLQFQEDAILVPPQTAWFGYYGENDFTTVLPPERVSVFQSQKFGDKKISLGRFHD